MADEQDLFEREIILNELRRVLSLAENDEAQFRSRSKNLTCQQRKFSKLQSKIEKALLRTKEFDKDEQLKVRNDFDDCFYAIQVHVDKLKREDEERRRVSHSLDTSFRSVQVSNNNGVGQGQNSKLPTLPLPSFAGESTDWPSFYDLFMSLVHGNSGYTDAEKFRYLLLTLKEEPFNLIKSIPITDENYLVALQILVSRYQNKRAIATKHLERILDIEPCSDKGHLSLRRLLNIYQENIKALEMMQFPTTEWDFILVNILLRKLSPSTRKRFELSLSKPNEIPSVSLLLNFLEREVAACEISGDNVGTSQNLRGVRGTLGASGVPTAPQQATRRSFAANVMLGPSARDSEPYNDRDKSCVMCEGSHLLTKCSQFLSMSPSDRYSSILRKNVCFNCLSVGHEVRQCKSNFHCRFCQKRHHSMIHFPAQQSLAVTTDTVDPSDVSLPSAHDEPVPAAVPGEMQVAMTSVAHSTRACDKVERSACDASVGAPFTLPQTVLLSTALVDIYADEQRRSTIRCLVDSGSQASFITEACVQRLGLRRSKVNVPVLGIGDETPVYPRGVVSVCITPTKQSCPIIPVSALILPKLISQMPSVALPRSEWLHLQHLKLADPTFDTPQPVDMLLGADVLPQILLGNLVAGRPGSPTALNTVFGYVLFGKVTLNSSEPTPLHACFSSYQDNELQRFWELESFNEKKQLTADESLCDSIYEKTVTRDATGRYSVALPFKPDAPPLGESRDIALARFRKLEHRLENNPKLKVDYHECLQEYVDLDHMEMVDKPVAGEITYYIPHHCVVKESSETTKTRVVFDAACKSTNGLSLNSILLTGPKLHKDIVAMLLGFRVHPIVFTADIKQMYRNILVQASDRDYQRIVWRKSPEEPIQDYRLRTVTFGVSSSPYLALRTIQQLAQDEMSRFPSASHVLLNNVFVDDILAGADTETGALALQKELVEICGTAGFELRKWHSNSSAILAATHSSVSHGERQESVPFAVMENDNKVKVLGLQWNPKSDSFSFSVQISAGTCSKRIILSEIAKIYDPMGWLSPVTLYAKHLMQLLWLAGVDWDEKLPVDIVNAWSNFVAELPLLSQVEIPRHIFPKSGDIQIHGFSDASEKAIAACIYLRVSLGDTVKVFLVLGKTRVAPLTPRLTVPRLELLAAQLLSRLIQLVMDTYEGRIRGEDVFAWSDSSVVLAWLRSPPYEWKTFVSNRTSEILSRVPASRWRHVPSVDNPADAPSRGMLPATFLQDHMWFSGPQWLQRDPSAWPCRKEIPKTEQEKRNLPVLATPAVPASIYAVDMISRFSTLGKLVRVTAFVFRFYNKIRKVEQSTPKHITVSEYNFSLNRLIQLVQRESFQDDLKNIALGKRVTDSLKRLSPFIDEKGLLRVGGRIDKSLLAFDSKHQLILPKRHHLTDLIIDEAHLFSLHAGPQSVRYLLMQRYWILSSRDIVRQRIHRCIRCFRARPERSQPRMGALPAARVRPARPFLKTSVDYAGPFYVRANKVRNAKVVKCYVAVFVCMSTKAVHLEIVSELSTEAFLAALRRFTSRRGLCTDIYSDCGTNFIGCNNYLKDLYEFLKRDPVQSVLNEQILHQGITWHFQPPYASHFGGLFEAGVKSFKHHLHRVVGTRTQTYDEMHTLLCQIEAVLNSRPLCLMSSAATDPLPLTPSHFLIGEPLTALPDVTLIEEIPNRLNRWRWIQQCVQHFWKKWSQEYLHELQQNSKWLHDRGPPIREGTVVVVCDENLPPLQWKLARVQATHPGKDNVIRVVTLQQGKSLFKRPVVKVCPLPLD